MLLEYRSDKDMYHPCSIRGGERMVAHILGNDEMVIDSFLPKKSRKRFQNLCMKSKGSFCIGKSWQMHTKEILKNRKRSQRDVYGDYKDRYEGRTSHRIST